MVWPKSLEVSTAGAPWCLPGGRLSQVPCRKRLGSHSFSWQAELPCELNWGIPELGSFWHQGVHKHYYPRNKSVEIYVIEDSFDAWLSGILFIWCFFHLKPFWNRCNIHGVGNPQPSSHLQLSPGWRSVAGHGPSDVVDFGPRDLRSNDLDRSTGRGTQRRWPRPKHQAATRSKRGQRRGEKVKRCSRAACGCWSEVRSGCAEHETEALMHPLCFVIDGVRWMIINVDTCTVKAPVSRVRDISEHLWSPFPSYEHYEQNSLAYWCPPRFFL